MSKEGESRLVEQVIDSSSKDGVQHVNNKAPALNNFKVRVRLLIILTHVCLRNSQISQYLMIYVNWLNQIPEMEKPIPFLFWYHRIFGN